MLKKTSKSSAVVSLADVKLHMALDSSSEDARITTLIDVADEVIENETGKKFIRQVWVHSDFSFARCFEIPFPPLVSLDSVKYYDEDETLQTVASSNYYVQQVETDFSTLEFKSDYDFPSTYNRGDAVQVTFTCGGDAPEIYTHIVKLLVSYWNEDREAIGQIPQGIMYLMNMLKTGRYI